MMTEQNREQLSAAMDGRLSQDELRFLLRRMEHDTSLASDWSRYHLVRDSLRRELPTLADNRFSSRVACAIDADTAMAGGKATPARRRRWLQWSAGGAIAASVAVAALMVGQPSGPAGTRSPGSGAVVATAASPTVSHRGMDVAAVGSPATVPAWLSRDSASALSQQASATLGAGPDGGIELNAPQGLAAYRLHRYRAVSNDDGSYLLLVDPADPADANTRPSQRDAQPVH